ncbi:effector-associated domain 2-containing protein [Thermomonospora umbrina]|uniref:Uncharacterized protein n=1 Tax=Thermomonospora umbrina TaxID=111806 RepID=A0A3D9SNE4_9ACTN|nr:hypothetical protein [Thermomonospora umbrina]REE95483.1 hypothetical protein DFJ69_0873 [Thermomonospora umbrina]
MIRSLGVEERRRLVEALWRLEGMRSRENRELYLSLLETDLGHPLAVKRDDHDLWDVWHLVHACLLYPGAIRLLLRVVEHFHRGSLPMIEITDLVEELLPEPLLLLPERRDLHRLLARPEVGDACDPATVRALYGRAVGPVGPVLERDAGDLRQVLGQLEDSTVRMDGVPPLLVFVADLGAHVRGAAARDLREWAGRVADRLGLARPALTGVRPTAELLRVSPPCAYLVIQLRPDPVDGDRYLPSAWLQHEGEPGAMLHCDDEDPLPLSRLPRLIEELLTETPEVVHRAAEELTIEFLLPRDLLAIPLDQYRITVGGLERRLGIEHPVVVRSLDRLHTRVLHHNWRRKWRWLTGRPGDATVHWRGRRGELNGEHLYTSLLIEQSSVCMAMAFPPARTSHDGAVDELWIGVQAGVPVIVWCREPRDPDRFAAEFEPLLARGMLTLPEAVLELRRRALRENDPDGDHLGLRLTLLFDDADRIPEPYDRLGAPA